MGTSGSSVNRVAVSADTSLRTSVRARIATIFRQEDGNVSRTARRLGVSRNTVYRAIRDGDRHP
jgi:transcriptional regulator of acetoin/glycerol metabolism